MEDATSNMIEVWLFEKGEWVSCGFICSRFDICERRLRFLGAGFLVSRPGGGYIHYAHATEEEMNAYCGPKRAHAIGELRNIQLLRRRRRQGRRPYPIEPATGQLSIL